VNDLRFDLVKIDYDARTACPEFFFAGNLLIVRSDPGDDLDPSLVHRLEPLSLLLRILVWDGADEVVAPAVLVDLARVPLDADPTHSQPLQPRYKPDDLTVAVRLITTRPVVPRRTGNTDLTSGGENAPLSFP
jgi:hypothetical protein